METRSYRPIFITAILALFFAVAMQAGGQGSGSGGKPILLGGTVVGSDRVLKDGWVLVQDGKIGLVSESKPGLPNAVEVNTGGIIFPGLIDLHNHISYNVFPRWHPGHLFSNRYEWRGDPDHIRLVQNPYDRLRFFFFCLMNTYGELRALAGGATSILATRSTPCIQGLVRNLDFNSGFYGSTELDREHILNENEVRPTTDPAVISGIKSRLADSRYEAFFVHLAEGVDSTSLDEFYFAQRQGLLTQKTAIIHGIPLGPTEFLAMRNAGVSLVWSPRSNIELYGKTANVAAALDAGVQVALAPDWAVTGGSNVLDELRYAAQWNVDHLSSRLTDEQFVKMVTAIPARIAGIDDQVGAVREGLYADLLVLSGDRNQPHRALIQAQASDVQLVLIGGQPVFGSPDFMGLFWNTTDLEEVSVDGKAKMVKMPDPLTRFSDVVSGLQGALAFQGTSLAPLTEAFKTPDFNQDGRVDFDDFFLFADRFGQPATGASVKFDLNRDGKIDFDDFFLFADRFGR